MKILIDIPKAFEVDYNKDRFAEFFQRCLADMGTCCGNYEFETAEMMEKAFAESKIYDPEKVVEQLEEVEKIMTSPVNIDCFGEECKASDCTVCLISKAIQIVKGGGVYGN
jgi:hypothetical protein